MISTLFPLSISPPLPRSRGNSLTAASRAASGASGPGSARQGARKTLPPLAPGCAGSGPCLRTGFSWIFCFPCSGRKITPTRLRKARSGVGASSCNPRMTFGQSAAQPEPPPLGAPNSNRCQSGALVRQLE